MGFVFNRETVTWLNWVEPQRVRRRADRFVSETLELTDLPSGAVRWWNPPARGRLERAVRRVFPDLDALTAPENREIADQFICFLGEMFIRRADMRWVNVAATGLPLYADIGPCVRRRHSRHTVSVVDVARSVVICTDRGRFGDAWSMLGMCIRPRAVDTMNNHDLPFAVDSGCTADAMLIEPLRLQELGQIDDEAPMAALAPAWSLESVGHSVDPTAEARADSGRRAEYSRTMDRLPPDVADLLRRSFPSAGERR